MAIVKTLLSAVDGKGRPLANFELWNYAGETCFYKACKLGRIEIARALESAGANVNSREGLSGNTPLMTAIINHNQDVINFLIECSSLSIDIENYRGQNVVDHCFCCNCVYCNKLAEVLRQRGATPFFTDVSDSDYEDSDSSSTTADLENIMQINKIAVT